MFLSQHFLMDSKPWYETQLNACSTTVVGQASIVQRSATYICILYSVRCGVRTCITQGDTCGLSLFIYFDSIKQSAVLVMHTYNAIILYCYHENETISSFTISAGNNSNHNQYLLLRILSYLDETK